MKIRSEFITNSSSSFYLVKNTSDSTKTLLDFMRDADHDDWWLVGGVHMTKGSNYKEGPFETIERLGLDMVREELKKLQEEFGDCYSLPKMLQ